MFVDRLVLEYNKSDTKLEESRQMLFNIKGNRKGTRQGDYAYIKIVYDFHAILCVIEGGEKTTRC
jgi:hypothetical protein